MLPQTAGLEANVHNSFSYLIKEGARNIYQNRAISIAAIGVLVACLLLVGASVLFVLNINSMVGYFESQNEILVFLSDDISNNRLSQIDQEIKQLKNLSSVTFVSREEGLRAWMEELHDDGTLLSWLINDNPLQNSYRLVVTDLSLMQQTIEDLDMIDGVDTISASLEVAQAVTGLKQAVTTGGIAVIIILAAVSVIIVANAIKMTVFNRRREITIMKYVGATDTFIRLPFLSEGILLGLTSAIFAFFLLWGGYSLLSNWLGSAQLGWAEVLLNNFVEFETVASKIALYFTAAGTAIGAFGSMIFVGKFLKV